MKQMGGSRRKGSGWWNNEMRATVAENRYDNYENLLRRRNEYPYERYRGKRVKVEDMMREAKRRVDVRFSV